MLRSEFQNIEHETIVRVRYADTDKMGVVYHAVYLVYFEVGRTELLRFFNLPYADLETSGVLLPVLEASVHYKRPAHYDDQIVVHARCEYTGTPRITIRYELRRNSITLVTGYTIHAFVEGGTMKPIRPPRKFTDIFLHNGGNQ